MTGFLKGFATALITPFKDGAINFNALERLLEYQIESGADAVVVLGTTGEPAVLSHEERQSIVRFAVEKVHKRIKVIVGTGCNDTAQAIKQSKEAEELGADGVLAVTPYYNKCTQAGLFYYYRDIAKSVNLPVICYNVPSRTGVNLLSETMEKIAQIPNIAGIKEASGNMAQVLETARAIRGKCDLYSGEDALNLPVLACGGSGVISVVSNLAPSYVGAMCEAVFAGDMKKAVEINETLMPLTKACFLEVNPIPVKAGVNYLGVEAGDPRSPLTPLEARHEEELYRAIDALHLEIKK